MKLDIPEDWTPTAENINALPEPLRVYIMRLATHTDPSFTLQENYILRQQVKALESMVAMLRD